MNYAKRTDANHSAVMRALRSCGWLAYDVSGTPGFFDAVAVRRGVVRFVEIKDGDKCPSARRLTHQQEKLHEYFAQFGATVVILTGVDDAIRLS